MGHVSDARVFRISVALAVFAAVMLLLVPSARAAGDGIDTPGVVRAESGTWGWWLSNDFHANVAHYFRLGSTNATPLVGDWDGDGIDSPGVNIGGNRWLLSDAYDGVVDYDFYYGVQGDVPLVGDWNGDGLDTIAIRRGHCFYWKNTLSGGAAESVTCFGNPSDIPVVGDWDGNGTDTPGVVRDAGWWLNNDFSGTVHHYFAFGLAGDRPLVGDWDGNGTDTAGVHRWNGFYLSNDFAGTTHHALTYGNPGDFPVAGDWNADPIDSWTDEASAFTPDSSGTRELAMAGSAPSPVIRYAPLVYIHPSEGNYPASARRDYLRHSSLRWARGGMVDRTVAGRGQISAIRLGDRPANTNPYSREVRVSCGPYVSCVKTYRSYDYTRPRGTEAPRNDLPVGDGFFLDFRGDRGGIRDLSNVPAYYHYSPGAFITYWFFYPWNDGVSVGNHEGDWERVVVKLSSTNTATNIAYYRHRCYRTATWAQASKVPNTQHPIVFAAEGAHGTYGRAGDQYDSCATGIVDYTAAGPAWRTWTWLADVTQQPWYGFGGAWGEIGSSDITTGPLGPSRYKRPAPPEWMPASSSSQYSETAPYQSGVE